MEWKEKNDRSWKSTKLKGNVLDDAKAKIMLSREKTRRMFYIALDSVAVLSLVVSITSFYLGRITNGLLSLLAGVAVLLFFLIRKYLSGNGKVYKGRK